MRQNKRKFWYSLYLGNVEVVDENGFYTGEKRPSYTKPIEFKANISAARSSSTGSVEASMFGSDVQYDKVIMIDNPDFEINEDTILCIDKAPEVDSNGKMVNDYIVTKAARSLNSVTYAISRVKVGM